MFLSKRRVFQVILLVPLATDFPFGALRAPAEQQEKRPELAKIFEKREEMIPCLDGVKLHTEIYTPKDAQGPLPILFERTPYGISALDKGMSRGLYRYADMFAQCYIFVFQDILELYVSEGKCEMLHTAPAPGDPKGVTESTDTYDTIEW